MLQNDNFKAFWGSPDTWIQERYQYSYEKLETELKLLSLLFDNIILSPAFLLESNRIDQLLKNNMPLIENGIIEFSFRNMNHNFLDYSNIKANEIIDKEYYKNKILINHLPDYNSSEINSKSLFWKDKIQRVGRKDELPSIIKTSLLSKFQVDIPNQYNPSGFKSLLNIIISNSEYYKKYDFYEALTIWQPSYYDSLYAIDKATLSFLLSSAQATNSFSALIFPNCALPASYQEYGVIGNLPYLMKIFTKLIGIEEQQILKINSTQIVNLRSLQEWKDFQLSYLDSIIKIEETLSPDIVYHTLLKSLRKESFSNIRNNTSKVLDNKITNTILSVGAGLGSVMLGLEPIVVPIVTAAPTLINKFISRLVFNGERQPIQNFRKIIRGFIDSNSQKENQLNELKKRIKNI